MGPNGAKRCQTGSNRAKKGQKGSYGAKRGQKGKIGANMAKWGHTGLIFCMYAYFYKIKKIMISNPGPQTKIGRAMGILLIPRF